MIANAAAPSDLWRLRDYLSQERLKAGRLFDYRYSVLLEAFGVLLRDGWINEAELAGLEQDKIERIKLWANL